MSFEEFMKTYEFTSSINIENFIDTIDCIWNLCRGVAIKGVVIVVDNMEKFMDGLSESSQRWFARMASRNFSQTRCRFIMSGSTDFFLDTGSMGGKFGGLIEFE